MARLFDTDIGIDLLEDVLEAWWRYYTTPNGEAESMGLSWAMVWILTQYHHFYMVKLCEPERTKHVSAGRINRVLLALCQQELL